MQPGRRRRAVRHVDGTMMPTEERREAIPGNMGDEETEAVGAEEEDAEAAGTEEKDAEVAGAETLMRDMRFCVEFCDLWPWSRGAWKRFLAKTAKIS